MNLTIPSSAAVALLAGPTWVAFKGEFPPCTHSGPCDFPGVCTGTPDVQPPDVFNEAQEPCKGTPTSCPRMTRQMCRWQYGHDGRSCVNGKRVLTFEAECPTCDGKGHLDKLHEQGGVEVIECPDWDSTCTAGTVTVSAHVVKCLPVDRGVCGPERHVYTLMWSAYLCSGGPDDADEITLHGDPQPGMYAVLLERAN